jgi:hypothetical protein
MTAVCEVLSFCHDFPPTDSNCLSSPMPMLVVGLFGCLVTVSRQRKEVQAVNENAANRQNSQRSIFDPSRGRGQTKHNQRGDEFASSLKWQGQNKTRGRESKSTSSSVSGRIESRLNQRCSDFGVMRGIDRVF